MRVVSNTAVALDGRIGTVEAGHAAFGTTTDRDYMSVLRARADAVLVGGRTFRSWPIPLVPDPAAFVRLRDRDFPDAEAPPLTGRRWWNVIVTRSGQLPTHDRFWRDPRVRPLVFAPEPLVLPGEVVVGDTSPRAILANLAARGVEHVLLECGGDLLYPFLEADLVDEVNVTLCPLVLGGRGAPTLADGPGFSYAAARRFQLVSAWPVGDEVYLRYARGR